MFFLIEFFFTFASYQFFTNDWIFIIQSLFFWGEIFSTKLMFPILQVKFPWAKIIQKKFLKETFFWSISIFQDF